MEYINNLGTYNSLKEVWAAYPEGGHDGDYVVVNGFRYAWNKYVLQWENITHYEEGTGRDTTVIDGDLVVQNNLTVAGTLRAKHVKQPNCGLFSTEEALKKAYPTPQVGMWATVGSAPPAAIWACAEEGVWYDTGEAGGIDAMDWERIIPIEEGVAHAVETADNASAKIDEVSQRVNNLEEVEGDDFNFISSVSDQVSILTEMFTKPEMVDLGLKESTDELEQTLLSKVQGFAEKGLFESYVFVSDYGYAERYLKMGESYNTIPTGEYPITSASGRAVVNGEVQRVFYFVGYQERNINQGNMIPGQYSGEPVYELYLWRLMDGDLYSGTVQKIDAGVSTIEWTAATKQGELTTALTTMQNILTGMQQSITALENKDGLSDDEKAALADSIRQSVVGGLTDDEATIKRVEELAKQVADNKSAVDAALAALTARVENVEVAQNTLSAETNAKIATVKSDISSVKGEQTKLDGRVTALENKPDYYNKEEIDKKLQDTSDDIETLRGETDALKTDVNAMKNNGAGGGDGKTIDFGIIGGEEPKLFGEALVIHFLLQDEVKYTTFKFAYVDVDNARRFEVLHLVTSYLNVDGYYHMLYRIDHNRAGYVRTPNRGKNKWVPILGPVNIPYDGGIAENVYIYKFTEES